ADQGDAPGAGQFHNAVRPHQFDKGLDLALLAGDFDHQVVRADIDHAGPEHFHQQHDLHALLGRGLDLEQHQVAFDEILAADILALDDGDDLVELFADLFQFGIVAPDDKRHPGEVGVFGLAHGQAVDVEAAGGEHPGNLGQDARLVLDQG